MLTRLRLISLATFLLQVLLIVIAQHVVLDPDERAQVADAERAARTYIDALDAYQASSTAALTTMSRKKGVELGDLLARAEKARTHVPPVPKTPRIAHRNDEVRKAAAERTQVVGRWTQWIDAVRAELLPAARLAKAGRSLVTLDPADQLKGVFFVTGDALTERVLPGFRKATDRIRKLDETKLDPLLRQDLVAYGEFVIDMTKDGAKRLTRGEAFHFEFGERPDQLFIRIVALERLVNSNLESLMTIL
jgi:hypothetical protein